MMLSDELPTATDEWTRKMAVRSAESVGFERMDRLRPVTATAASKAKTTIFK